VKVRVSSLGNMPWYEGFICGQHHATLGAHQELESSPPSDDEEDGARRTRSGYDRQSYDYSTLAASEVLVTTDDLGRFHHDRMQKGQGLWVHYILAKERRRTLQAVNPEKLKAEGRRYRMKSITNELAHDGDEGGDSHHSQSPPGGYAAKEHSGHHAGADKFIHWCLSHGIKVIVPASVPDTVFVSRHKAALARQGVFSLTCEDSNMHFTLDHKWLCYELLSANGVNQPLTMPVRKDTAEACLTLVHKNAKLGIPCFLKETYDTLAGDGVAKVKTVQEFEDAVKKFSHGKPLQPADTPGSEQHLILQEGHPGDVHEGQALFYKGQLVSCYLTRENPEVIDCLGEQRTEMSLGRLAPGAKEKTLSLQLPLTDDRTRDAMLNALHCIGVAAEYTGMVGVEFIIARDPETGVMTDDEATVLEINARFSGGIHSTMGSGMIQDYMGLLAAVAHGVPDDKLPGHNDWPLVRSDGHIPQSDFLKYNPVGWHLRNLDQLLSVRHMWP